MATSRASQRYNLILAVVVITFLPLLTLLLWFNYAAVVLADQKKLFLFRTSKPRKTVLITGARNPYGLNLARSFYRAGYRVIGADLKSKSVLNIAKRSRVLAKHYDLPQLSAVQDIDCVARSLSKIVKAESVNLWIECSQDIPEGSTELARREVERNKSCLCFADDGNSSSFFASRETFIEFLQSRNLPTTEFHKVKSRAQIHNVLNDGAKSRKQYVLSGQNKTTNPKTLLPRRSKSQTYHDISILKFSPNSYMVLEELMDSSSGYECLAVVVRGSIESFWVRRKGDHVNEHLSKTSGLWQALRSYTESVAHELGYQFSNHLVLTFGVVEKVTHAGVVQQILPADGSTRLNPDFVLSINKLGFDELVKGYQSVFNNLENGASPMQTTPGSEQKLQGQPQMSKQHYFLMDELKESFLIPCFRLLLFREQITHVLSCIVMMLTLLVHGQEVFYDFWDPLPAYWEYSIVFLWQTLLE